VKLEVKYVPYMRSLLYLTATGYRLLHTWHFIASIPISHYVSDMKHVFRNWKHYRYTQNRHIHIWCMCIRASYMELTRDTHLMQQFIYYYK